MQTKTFQITITQLVELLYQHYKADKLEEKIDDYDFTITDGKADLYETDNWNIVLDILGYPKEPETGKETENDIARDWLYDHYYDIFKKDLAGENEIKAELYNHLEYLMNIIEEKQAGKDIEPYFQEALRKKQVKA